MTEEFPKVLAEGSTKSIRDKYKRWEVANNKAPYYMLTSMVKTLKTKMANVETAYKMMDQLQDMFGEKYVMNKLQTFESIMGGQSKGEEKITTGAADDSSKSDANLASYAKARNKKKGGCNTNPKLAKAAKTSAQPGAQVEQTKTQPDVIQVEQMVDEPVINQVEPIQEGRNETEQLEVQADVISEEPNEETSKELVQSSTVVKGYSDADYAGDRDSRKSTSTYVFSIGGNCINWKVQLQPVVPLSTTESEYIATTEAIKEAIWIKGLMGELKILHGTPTVYSDNKSCIHLYKILIFHDRTKHVEIKYHFIRVKVTQREIAIEKVPTEDKHVHMGTKRVTLIKFIHCINLLRIATDG
ncbi:uncharacterized protein LOC133796179 [Humulus lupulus]|uniref:uncharacterized protein LOC133796179 n=1 Tax=Humulus lupulus TaxID=3486 RepID=UPI002B4073AB|nr:uncharacterized protein LOC133796179 [Humulus lupulus]